MFRMQSGLRLHKALLNTSTTGRYAVRHVVGGSRRFSTKPIIEPVKPVTGSGSSITDYIPEVVKKNAGMTIFMSIIGGIVYMIYTTSAATTNFNEVKEKLQAHRILVRAEQTELMIHNRTFTASTFEDICKSLPSAFPNKEASYQEFVTHVQGYLEAPIKGGNYLDRVILDRRSETHRYDEKEDVRLFMVMLSLVLETEYIEDRARALFKLLSTTKSELENTESSNKENTLIDMEDVITIIDYLHMTCQIPVEKKVIKGLHKYPVQTYQEASPKELAVEASNELKLDSARLTEEEFVNVLLSNAVCAWGSCRARR